eukprot:m.323314 g.323314  ORF g.323314 m.323314 type:complete len:165 (-) comp16455_c0_seq46:3257-3751(-)
MTARVTVVGSGIAGLSAAYHIAKHGTVEVTLFEKNDVLGGHEMTHDTKYGQVDLGYMVMNFECYPNLTRFYREHMIPLERTDMGFSVQSTQFQWSFSNSLSTAARSVLFSTSLEFNANCLPIVTLSRFSHNCHVVGHKSGCLSRPTFGVLSLQSHNFTRMRWSF